MADNAVRADGAARAARDSRDAGATITARTIAAPVIVAAARSSRRRRSALLTVVLILLLLLIAGVSLAVGDYLITLPELVQTLLGRGDPRHEFIVLTLRMPRLALALVAGILFGLAGALFQSVLRNPLASPDIIGISGGASAAAVFAILVLGLSGLAVAAAAFAGALAVAAAIYLLSWRAGVTGFRFVLVGIGFSFMVSGVLGYLLTRADVRDAQAAFVWLVGSVSGARWADVGIAAGCLALLLPFVAVYGRRLGILQLGDETATGLGLRVNRTRLGLLLVAVALAAAGTAACGPVAFVAFVAAPIARRILGTGAAALTASALVGALIVSTADLVAQHLLPGGVQVPVGVITGVIGAPYLLWLLARPDRASGGS